MRLLSQRYHILWNVCLQCLLLFFKATVWDWLGKFKMNIKFNIFWRLLFSHLRKGIFGGSLLVFYMILVLWCVCNEVWRIVVVFLRFFFWGGVKLIFFFFGNICKLYHYETCSFCVVVVFFFKASSISGRLY